MQTENNSGNDFQLPLEGALSEEEVMQRRAEEFEAAERDRVAQITSAEAEIAEQVAAERQEAESDAMHAWWRVRRGELRAQASQIVDAEISGHVDGCADSMEVRCGRCALQGKALLCNQGGGAVGAADPSRACAACLCASN